jgi:multicomponent Na+:H+ antiporter subunit D
MYVAGFTLLTSSIIALTKDNLKARLAYSTISQLSYVVLGGALATTSGILGGGMHIAMHAMGKITLFFCAGAIFVAHHKTDISTMNGIGRSMPFTMAAFFLGSLCIIGLPPMGGLWSKWFIGLGAIEADQEIFVALLMLSSLLSVGYLLPVVVRAFFFEPDPDVGHTNQPEKGKGFWVNLHEAPLMCVGPLCMTALGCILLFFYASDVYELLFSITVER